MKLTPVPAAMVAVLLLLSAAAPRSAGQALVPGVMIFGDSVVDAGNNNRLATLVRADFPPYGRDFPATHSPTGRFCNGKLATDYTVENLGFSSYPPAYLSEEAQSDNKSLLHGANFASGGAGYLDATAAPYGAISLSRQLEYFREYQSRVAASAGAQRAAALTSGSIYVVSAGTSDYVQNYYVNQMLSATYSPDQFADVLMQPFTSVVESLYGLGARRIGVTSLPPMGCLPASVTLFGGGGGGCVERLNNDSLVFNQKLGVAAGAVQRRLPDLKLVVFDIYQPLLDLVSNPTNAGFFESRRACCGTGTIETSVLCHQGAPGTCTNATGYVFWDGFHPTDASNKVLADALLLQGLQLI
ncbi:GDSL esterase/lipase At3g53100 [Phragmites australis]|uniref:GDSL esterase/lipase At3g53100 n=1 Tax=Phragmites australis TaxID=29695 RepID=UPI002D7A29CC|nr:GDSL esterase/lipase At3g53100 [Phragmites australis]